jgi:hypothetical protein
MDIYESGRQFLKLAQSNPEDFSVKKDNIDRSTVVITISSRYRAVSASVKVSGSGKLSCVKGADGMGINFLSAETLIGLLRFATEEENRKETKLKVDQDTASMNLLVEFYKTLPAGL